jgi:hypothetical protein
VIQPLLVIHQAHQWVLLGRIGQQVEHGQTDDETVRRKSAAEAKSGPQRGALRSRESVEAIQHRRAQLMYPGEGELHLRLDTDGARHPAAGRVFGHVVQQRRLAYALLATDHQGPALPRMNGLDETVEHVARGSSAPKPQRRPFQAEGSSLARYQHYGLTTMPWSDRRLRTSCLAVSIKASISGPGARMRKQPFGTPASDHASAT